jgi:crotonobetainyl-CoA:carnitine CoA-transferase CaiB-like acyl-CoA transferase
VLATGQEARRYGNAHPSIVPYQLFEAADRSFAMGGATDRHYRLLCERVLERPELATDERFATNRARVTNRHVLVPILQELFRERTAEEWVQRCLAANIPSSLVQGVLEALRGETGRPLIAAAGGYEFVRHPVRFDGERLPVRTLPPRLGEHTAALQRELAVREQQERETDGEDERHQPGHETKV